MNGSGMAAIALGLLMAGGCGGSSSSTATSPSPSAGSGTSTTPSFSTVTISSNAVSPKSLIVPRGSRVTFFNNDNRTHEMNSDPHPAHTDCPEINAVGFLSPGQSRQTDPMNTARTCGYHDHSDAANSSLQGTITIQ